MPAKPITTAAVVLAIAITPSITEARDAWEDPRRRWPVVAWYGLVTVLALAAWRQL